MVKVSCLAGVQTLRYKQSSLMFRAGDPGRGVGGFARGQVAEYSFTGFTPSHGCTGVCGRHRGSPTGEAANGIP